MPSIFDTIATRLLDAWKSGEPSGRKSAFECRCGRLVFFNNSVCLGCQAPLGFDPESLELRAMTPAAVAGTWTLDGGSDDAADDGAAGEDAELWKRCANFELAAGCNWLVRAEEAETLCRSCRLNRTIPNLGDPQNGEWWQKIEVAKRRMVAQLLSLGLPVVSESEDPARGLAFDFLRSPENGPRVLTGHADGLITLNVEEADDSVREKTRNEMREPYRTLLGHFRHEVGHYYWDRLVADTPWLEKFRALYGDEREDYGAALQRNYEQGPPADWANQHITSYASVHPWEDWAETWAHYLHVVDSLDTALRFGLDGEDVELEVEPFVVEDLYDPEADDAETVILLVNSWVRLTNVLNELARSMGQHDFYPFVMSRPVLRKMHFIQMIVKEARGGTSLVEL